MSILRGWLGEIMTQFGMWIHLDGKIYRRIHNVVLPARVGTTQIDHVVVSIFGIFVIETKNKKGWIFGDEREAQWTQSIYGKKYRFQNPLRQNYAHTQALADYLGLDQTHFHSAVFFSGDCTFKTPMPANVRDRGLSSYIRSFAVPSLTPVVVESVIARLQATRLDPTLTNAQHVQTLHARFASNDTCPKCGGHLIERVARTGKNIGKTFLGCDRYPKCRFTKQRGTMS